MVRDWQEGRDKLLTFVTPKLERFEAVEKKPLYQLCVKVCCLHSLVGVKVSKWTKLFGQDKSLTSSWRSLYKLPVNKHSADLQWRIIHGAITTNGHMAHLDPGHGRGCLFFSFFKYFFGFIECTAEDMTGNRGRERGSDTQQRDLWPRSRTQVRCRASALFCAQDESLVHLFTECPHLAGLLGVMVHRFWGTVFFGSVYLWSKIQGEKKDLYSDECCVCHG